ncbi:protein L [Yersinia alsatica]|uniref:protein L n=1 Tax=Yersinia alsatica TaxID=2890317 RepID=UPI0011A316FD|nr:protein L [Yersinia alsatica]
MAAYTSDTEQFLQKVGNGTTRWTTDYSPSDTVPVSGIYRCKVCGKEITSNKDDPFPPQNHHQHSSGQKISWQLIVRTDTNGDRFGLK